MPHTGVDINSDGFMDVIMPADGKGIEIYRGNKDELFTKRSARQKMSRTGRIHFSDLDDDGLPDFVMYDSPTFDAPVQIGRNRGELHNLAIKDDE